MHDAAKAQLYHELAKLSGAGFPITQAAETALDARPPADQRRFLEGLKSGIEGGARLSGAADAAGDISPLEVSVLRAAEEGGRIPEGFGHLARYFEMRHKAARKIRAGLVYPAVLLHLAVLLPALPKAAMSRDIGGTAIGVATTLFAAYALVCVGVLAYRRLSRSARDSRGADSLLRRIPMVGKTRHAFALSRFAEVLRIGLLSGRGPLKSLRSAADASGSGTIRDAVATEVLPEIESGHPAGPALLADRGRNFPPTFARAYATAEESGTLDTEMGRWATAFAGQAETAIDRLSAAAPKVIYFGVVILVVWQIFQLAGMYFAPIQGLMDGTGSF